MPLPVNVATCTVTGAFVNSDGTVPSGTVEFTPRAPRMLDGTAAPPATIVAVPITATLIAGAFSVDVPATDDADLDPSGWCYQVRVHVNGHPYSFEMQAPAGTLDLAEVTPI